MLKIVSEQQNHKSPFRSVGHCLFFYNNHNPARLKSTNFFEPERGGGTPEPDLSGASSVDLYASITLGLAHVLRTAQDDARLAFALRNFGDREHHYSVEDIAKLLHRNIRTIYRYLDKIYEHLEREFARRELIEPLEILNHDH